MSRRVLAIFGLLTGFAILIGGCGGADTSRVSGEVTYNGQPVKAGMISFEPTKGQDQVRSVPIRDGRYDAEAQVGLTPGSYLVRLTAPDLDKSPPPSAAVGPNDPVSPSVPLLPPTWNDQSKLTVDLDTYLQALAAEGVGAGRSSAVNIMDWPMFKDQVTNLHACAWTCPLYKGKVDYDIRNFPGLQKGIEGTLRTSINEYYTVRDVSEMIKAIRKVTLHYAAGG